MERESLDYSDFSMQSLFNIIKNLDTIKDDNSLSDAEKGEQLKQANDLLQQLIKEKRCETCNNFCANLKSCESCIRRFLENNSFNSGNGEINDIIKDCQRKFQRPDFIVEWIPYNNLRDIEYITEGGLYYKVKAIWRDGRYVSWDSEGLKLKRFGPHSVTIKNVNKNSGQDQWIQEIRAHLLLTTNMSPVIHCYGVTKDQRNSVMIVTENVEMNLQNYLQKNINSLTWAKKYGILQNILESLASIHKNKLIHGDLNSGIIKYSNRKEMWLIGDLKHCRPVDNSLNRSVGTMPYVAPEHLKENCEPITAHSDIYSFGIIMWEISTGVRPSDAKRLPPDDIVAGKRPDIMDGTPSHYSEIMQKCWAADPESRPKLGDITSHIKGIMDNFYKGKMQKDQLDEMRAQIFLEPNFNVVNKIDPKVNVNPGTKGIPIIGYDQIVDVKLVEGIGSVNYASVSLEGKGKSQNVVIKTLQNYQNNQDSSSMNNSLIKLLREKISNWNEIYQHKNIVEYLALGIKDENSLFLVTPYTGDGNLRDFYIKSKPNLERKIKIAQDITEGIVHLHKNNIVHQNINPTNILIFGETAKISNLPLPFENRDILKNIDFYVDETIFDNIGYMDPSLLLTKDYRENKSVDIYSLGSLLWEIMSEKVPYSKDHDDNGILQLVKEISKGMREKYENPEFPGDYIKLYKDCWDGNSLARPTIQEVSQRLSNINYKQVN